jgi:hypothetical protein
LQTWSRQEALNFQPWPWETRAIEMSEGVELGVDGEASPGHYPQNLYPDRNWTMPEYGLETSPYPYARVAWELGEKPLGSQMELR